MYIYIYKTTPKMRNKLLKKIIILINYFYFEYNFFYMF